MENDKDVITSFKYGMDGGLELAGTLVQEEIIKIGGAIDKSDNKNLIAIHEAMQGLLKALLISFEHCKYGEEISPELLAVLRKTFS